MHDANGNTYGTAHEMKECTAWTFQPNGTFTTNGLGATQGRYLLHTDGTVTVFETATDTTAPAPKPYDLRLSTLTPLP
ncbi:MAG TPA: hypothetical protein VGM39_20115 [Kofleriaceae bacterium]|jgi:hypothetical protein